MSHARRNSSIIDPVSQRDLARLRAFLTPGVVNHSEHLWRTGQRRNYYIDIDPMLNDPANCRSVVEWYVQTLWGIRSSSPRADIGALAFIEKSRESGGTIGALRLAGAISIGALVPHYVVRLGREISSQRIKSVTGHDPSPASTSTAERFTGQRFAVITDHCTRGDEVWKAIEIIRDSGGVVDYILTYSIIDAVFDWSRFEDQGIAVRYFLKAPDDLLDLQSGTEGEAFGFELKQDG